MYDFDFWRDRVGEYLANHPHFRMGIEHEQKRILKLVWEYVDKQLSGSTSINRTTLKRLIEGEHE